MSRTLEDLEAFLAAELERYKARALAELADADPYLAGHLAGNINALVTVRAWLGPAPEPVYPPPGSEEWNCPRCGDLWLRVIGQPGECWTCDAARVARRRN